MRMADAELLPFDFHNFADTVHTYVGELKKLLKDQQTEIEETNKELDEGVFTAIRRSEEDPRRRRAQRLHPPYLNFAPLENADATLTESADRFTKALAAARAKGPSIDPQTLAEINGLLIQSERKLTLDAGLPGRPWYKHQIYAPGAYTGYGVKTLPAVREAMEQENWKQAEEQTLIDTATGLLGGK
jgi:N-acetylated-alpha-linked acidic dipeptidase